MSTYLQVLIYSLSIPLLFTFHAKIKFHKQWLAFFKANIITAIPISKPPTKAGKGVKLILSIVII